MQNIPPELDLLIVGNEPAGLWLLKEYDRLNSQANPSLPAQMGWLQLNYGNRSIPVTVPTARQFNIPISNSFSAEIASNKMVFRWSPEKVFSHFKSLPRSLESHSESYPLAPVSRDRKIISNAIVQQPELLTFSQALWKRLGRCRKVTPEMIVWGALQALELSDWEPETLIQGLSGLKIFSINNDSRWVSFQEIKSSNPQVKEKIFKLSFSSGEVVLTKKLVLNLTVRQWKKLTHGLNSSFREWLSIPPTMLSRYAHYPITLEFERYRLPKNVQPLTILFDQEVLPEPDQEMWPMTTSLSNHSQRQKVTLWATDRSEFSYEGVTQNLGKALARFNYHFPNALKELVEQSVPLGLESCYSEAQRAETIEMIEDSQQELYGVSLLHARTRKKGLFALWPALHCTLPYPLGTLTAAKEILTDFFNRKTLQKYTPARGLTSSTSP